MYTMMCGMSPVFRNFCDVVPREGTSVSIAGAAETGPVTKAVPAPPRMGIRKSLSPRQPGWEMPIVRRDDPHHSVRKQRTLHQPRTIQNLTIPAGKVNQGGFQVQTSADSTRKAPMVKVTLDSPDGPAYRLVVGL